MGEVLHFGREHGSGHPGPGVPLEFGERGSTALFSSMASGILPRGVATFELALFDPAFCATTGYWGFVDATFSKDSLHEKDFEERGRELCSAVVKITDELLGIFEESVLLREGSVPGSLEGVLEQFKEHFTRIGEKLERAQQSEIDSGSDSHAQAEQLVGGREDADGTDDQIRLPVKSSDTPLHGWAYRDAGRKRPPIGTRAHGTEPGDIPLFKHFTKSSRMSISTLQRMERIVPHWIRKFSSYVAWRRHEVSRMHDHEVSEMVANSEMLLLCPLGEEASHQLSRLDAYGALGNESAEEAATLFGPCACDIDRHSHTGALCGEFHTHAKGIHLQYDVNKRNLFWTRVDGTRRTHGTPCSLLGMKVLRRDLEVRGMEESAIDPGAIEHLCRVLYVLFVEDLPTMPPEPVESD